VVVDTRHDADRKCCSPHRLQSQELAGLASASRQCRYTPSCPIACIRSHERDHHLLRLEMLASASSSGKTSMVVSVCEWRNVLFLTRSTNAMDLPTQLAYASLSAWSVDLRSMRCASHRCQYPSNDSSNFLSRTASASLHLNILSLLSISLPLCTISVPLPTPTSAPVSALAATAASGPTPASPSPRTPAPLVLLRRRPHKRVVNVDRLLEELGIVEGFDCGSGFGLG
jgi:hypothetical protein